MVLLVVLVELDFVTLLALTKLAQATGAGSRISLAFILAGRKQTRTTVHICYHKAALAEERLARGIHAHVFVDVAVIESVLAFCGISFCCALQHERLTSPESIQFRFHQTRS